MSSPSLRYVSPDDPGFTRRRAGGGFCYLDCGGETLRDRAFRERAAALAIPPAWTQVWICPSPHGHLQALGYDARGRRQYIYHPEFRRQRDAAKFERLVAFAAALPKVRAQVEHDLTARGLPRHKVLAAIVRLLDSTLVRVGNKAYAQANGSFGLTTLRGRHLKVEGAQLRLRFKGKGGKPIETSLVDRRLSRVIREIQDLPGQAIFQYLDEHGDRHSVDSADVNDYLKTAAEADITAKDFRTWGATVAVASSLLQSLEEGLPPAKTRYDAAIRRASRQLGNTPSVCRGSYVHPTPLPHYERGRRVEGHHVPPPRRPEERRRP